MSGETEAHPSAWTIDSVHVHLLDLLASAEALNAERFRALREELHLTSASAKEAVNAALASADKAATLFAQATKDHFTLSNGLQTRMDQQARDLIGRNEALTELKSLRAEMAAGLKAVDDKVDLLTARSDRAEPLHALTSRVDSTAGAAVGKSEAEKATERSRNFTIALMGVALAVAALLVSVIGVLGR